MAGAKRKAPNALAGHRGAAGPLRLVPPSEPSPTPTRGWLKMAKTDWELYWKSSVASQIDRNADLPALRRLFDMRDELDRSMRAYKAKPMVIGSQGQMVLNPVRRSIAETRAQIKSLEEHFGMTPLSRARLGWTIAEGASSAEDLRRLLNMDGDEMDFESEADDVIDGESRPLV